MKQRMNKITAALLAAVFLLSVASPGFAAHTGYPDVAGHWAERTICELTADGIIHGYGDGTCRPDENITRAQFGALVARYFSLTAKEADASEVDTNHWAAKEITGLIEKGIIRPADYDGRYDMDAAIPRMEMIRMIVRAIGKETEAVTLAGRTGFADDGEIAGQDRGYINAAKKYDIISGYPDGTVRPYTTATRAEGFVILKRLMAAYEEIKKAEASNGGGNTQTGTGGPPIQKPAERVPEVTFTLPATAHTDTALPVDATMKNADETGVVWSAERDGQALDLADAVDGALNSEGSVIRFKEPGLYTVTATVKNEKGTASSCKQTIRVYPVAEISLTVPDTAHTDESIKIKVDGQNLTGLPVTWRVQKDGTEVEPTAYIAGNLTDSGGALTFTAPGTYTLTAAAADETGRSCTASATVTVYPVGMVGFFLPTVFHTDDTVRVETSIHNSGGSPLVWMLTRDGKSVAVGEYITGTLTENGGEISVREKGDYVLTASFTDATGRAYSYTQAFKVYPIPTVKFEIPSTAWTDTELTVSAENTGTEAVTVEWLVDNTYGYQDWNTFVDGRLNNSGGTIRFKRAGTYELVARITDATGRVFLFERDAKCEVQPVLQIKFTLPEVLPVTDKLNFRTSGHNNVLPVEWTLTKDGELVNLKDYVFGRLNAYGGKIQFAEYGSYTLTAAMTDVLGRSFTYTESLYVYPIATYQFVMPETCHIGTPFQVAAGGDYLDGCTVDWQLKKDGEAALYDGALAIDGGEIAVKDCGAYTLTAAMTDPYGNTLTVTHEITIINHAPAAPTIHVTADYSDVQNPYTADCKVMTTITVTGGDDPDGDSITYEYDNFVPDGYYGLDGPTVKVRAVDEWGMVSEWVERKVPVSLAEPTVTLQSPTLGVGTTTDQHEVEFHAMVTSEAEYTLSTVEYFDRSGAKTTAGISADTADNLVEGHYEDGRRILVARVTDIFGRSAYVTRYFIVGPDQDSASGNITELSTILQNEGISDEGGPIVYISSFTFSVPAIPGHSTNCKDVVTITGVLPDGTEEEVLTFCTNNGYVLASSDGTYEYTRKGSTVCTETWEGWEPQRYVQILFHYEMLAGHESCIANATEGMRYTVGYSFILDNLKDLDKLFQQ